MALHRPKRDRGERRSGARSLARVLLVGTLLSTGCIPSSTKYPYLDPDANTSPPDAASADADAGAPDASPDAGCLTPSAEELCEEVGAECGATTETDRCGVVRTINCGDCGGGGVCNLDNQCCQQQNDTSLCEERNAECGMLVATDNCGVLREDVPCGTCPNPGDCEGTTCGACVRESDAAFCSRFGKACDSWSGVDNCGDTRENVPCGSCQFGSSCTNGVCVCPTGTVEKVCDDDDDNDCDGLTDCQDPDCDELRCGPSIGGILFPTCNDSECS